MAVQAVFIVFLMLPAVVRTDDAKGWVKFWRRNVTLTCPGEGQWFITEADNSVKNLSKKYEFQYDESNNKYHCIHGGTTYQFYVEGKVCENCIELDASVFLGVIVADLMATVIVMMMVFKCTKRKDSVGPSKTSRAPAPPEGRPPPVPPSNYEPLNPRTRSQDTYSLVNRTG